MDLEFEDLVRAARFANNAARGKLLSMACGDEGREAWAKFMGHMYRHRYRVDEFAFLQEIHSRARRIKFERLSPILQESRRLDEQMDAMRALKAEKNPTEAPRMFVTHEGAIAFGTPSSVTSSTATPKEYRRHQCR